MIGPNGAGKSTLLRAVGGLLRVPRHGRAVRHGQRARCAGASAPGWSPPCRRPRWCRPAWRCSTTCCSAVRPYIPPLGRESAGRPRRGGRGAGAAGPAPVRRSPRWRRSPAASGSGRSWPGRWPRAPRCCCSTSRRRALDIGHQQEVLELVDELRARPTVSPCSRPCTTCRSPASTPTGWCCSPTARVVAAGTPREVLTEELLARHYGARVRVIDGEHGPLVVPVRTSSA